MANERKYRCSYCGVIITLSGGYAPEPKMGGPCPKSSFDNGEHAWVMEH